MCKEKGAIRAMPKNKNIKTKADKLKEEFYKGMRELRESQKKTDAEIDKLKDDIKETTKSVKELSTNVGGIGNSIGKIPEYMSLPDIEQDFYKFKIDIKKTHPNVSVKYNGKAKSKEIDLILVGKFNRSKVAVVVETQLRYKSSKEIDEFHRFLKEELKQILDEYKNYKVIGCVCALGYGTGLEKYAERKGLFVMKLTKGIVGIINKPDFKFKIV